MKYLWLALLTSAIPAQAEVFTCLFNPSYAAGYPTSEAAYQVTYDSSTQQLILADSRTYIDIPNVQLVIVGPEQFELQDSKNQTLMTLHRTGRGSDGISDKIYPYEAEHTERAFGSKETGVCESSLHPSHDNEKP